jgi:hypothetical protein
LDPHAFEGFGILTTFHHPLYLALMVHLQCAHWYKFLVNLRCEYSFQLVRIGVYATPARQANGDCDDCLLAAIVNSWAAESSQESCRWLTMTIGQDAQTEDES